MTPREYIDDWHSGPDPIYGAMAVARQSGGEMTPGDCLRIGMVPAGWYRTHRYAVAGDHPQMRDTIYGARLDKARRDIEDTDRAFRAATLAADITPDELNECIRILRVWAKSQQQLLP